MLLTEKKVRKVIRQTMRQNNYRINERFYRDLNNNLIQEGVMSTLSNAFNKVKDKFVSSKKEKDVKGMKKPATIFSQLLIPLTMIALFNSVSDGKIAEAHINDIRNAAEAAAEVMEVDALESGSVDDMLDVGSILDLINAKQMSLKEMKDLISAVKNLDACKKLQKELSDLENQLSSLDLEGEASQDDLDNFMTALGNILDSGDFNPSVFKLNGAVLAVMTNNL